MHISPIGRLSACDRRFSAAFAVILAYGTLLTAILVAVPGGQSFTSNIDQGLQALAVCLGIVLCMWNGSAFHWLRPVLARHGGSTALIPLLTVSALLGILAGTLLDIYFSVALGHGTPTPYWDDLLFLSAYLLFLPATWLLAGHELTVGRSVRSLLDGLIVLCAIIACAWTPVLGPILQHATGGPWAKVVFSCYPVLSCLVLTSVILAWMHRPEPRRRPALALFSLAGGLLALSITVNMYKTLQGTYHTGDLCDAGWPVALMLCGLTAAVVRSESMRVQPSRTIQVIELDPPPVWRLFVPYMLLPIVLISALASWRSNNRDILLGTFSCDWLLAGVVTVRQVIELLENRRLIAEQSANERTLRYQARHDALTGLPNRRALQESVERMLKAARRDTTPCALLVLDLDRFREVNDALGHAVGDWLLQETAARLQALVPAAGGVARLGSDEFAALVPGRDAGEVQGLATEIIAAMKAPLLVEGQSISIGMTVGAAIAPEHGDEATVLLQRADVAIAVAKRDGISYCLYDPALDGTDAEQLTLLADLRESLEHGHLVLYYQPKVAMGSGQICGVEALVRWPHPTKGLISPDRFVPLAEQSGLIGPLTTWVLDAALAQCAAWVEAGLELQVAVNLSMRNLRDATIVALVEQLLQRHGVPSRLLCLELTESTIMTDVRGTRETLRRLADLGVRLAIDDFGTGYSSLSYLTTLPVHELKIDRSFVREMKTRSENQCIVALTIGLAHSLGLEVVTEGVEDAETWAMLAQLGADQAQGYYMSRPVPAEDIMQPIITWSALLSIGIELVDRQHQVLIGLINRLHEAMNHGRDGEVVGDVLNGLVEYMRVHFATEEQLMLRHAYPGYGEHKAVHDDFVQQVAATRAGFLRGEVVVTLPLAQFLRDWLTRHLLEMDKHMGAYLSGAADRDELPA